MGKVSGCKQPPNTSADILSTLAGDDNRELRLAVASNPNTEAGILATLTDDDDVLVRDAALKNLSNKEET